MLKSVFILLISQVLKNMRSSILSLLKKIDAPLVSVHKKLRGILSFTITWVGIC